MEAYANFYPISLPSVLPQRELSPSSTSEINIAKIKSVAKEALLQVGLALALNLTVLAFFATSFSAAVFSGALIGGLAAVIIQTAVDLWGEAKNFDEVAEEFEHLKYTSQVSMVNVTGFGWPNIAIHEGGHALAAWLCFKKAWPQIEIFPFTGGITSYNSSYGLTNFGAALGKDYVALFVTAAGMLSSTFFAMFEFAIADWIKEDYPTISSLMNTHGVLQIVQEVLYGLSTFYATKVDLMHDFVKLWLVGGIHPLIPMTMMIILPLLEIGLLNFLSGKQKAQKIQEAVVGII